MLEVSWVFFIAASLILIVTPGQDMMLVMSRSIAQGPTAGIITAAGVSVGLVGHTVLATLGLGAILAGHSQPVAGERKFRSRHDLESERVAVEAARALEIFGSHEVVIEFGQRHLELLGVVGGRS